MNAPQPKPYDLSALSQEEKTRFLTALGDGFGFSHRRYRNLEERPLPESVERGLLEHRAHYSKDEGQEPDDDEEEESEFWKIPDGDIAIGLYEQCPINFHLPAIRQYFAEQKVAYLSCAEAINYRKRMESVEGNWEGEIYARALRKTYSKAWYEYHINEHISFVERSISDIRRLVKEGIQFGVSTLMLMDAAAVLGRLIEQYYWKFLLEKSAIRGVKISDAVKAGGNALAAKRKGKQAQWQAEASKIWKEDPTKQKKAVAYIVKERSQSELSVKHISRFIKRP